MSSAISIQRRTVAELAVLAATMLAGAALYLRAEIATLGNLSGLPLDDGFIHLVFARSLAGGSGFRYGTGPLVAGSTGPLWTALLSGLSLLPGNVVVWTKLMGLFLHLGSSWMALGLARTWGLRRGLALFAAVSLGLTSWLVWSALSGMEISLFVLLCLAGVWAHLRELERRQQGAPWSLLLLAASALARPEGLLLLALALLERLVQLPAMSSSERRTALVSAIAGGCAAVVLLFPAALLSWVSHHSLLPTTFSVKVQPGHKWLPTIRDLWREGQILFVGQPWLTLLAGGGAVRALSRRMNDDRHSLLPVLWLLGLPLAYSLMTPPGTEVPMGNFGRYVFPLLPFVCLLGARGLDPLATLFEQRARLARRKSAAIALGCVLLAAPTVGLLRGARFYALNVANVEQSDVAAGRWIAANLPAEALLGLQDVGAVTFETSNPIVDLVGLVDPQVLHVLHVEGNASDPQAFGRLMDEVRARRVDALVLFPESYGWERLQAALPGLRPIHSWRVERNITMAGSELVVALTPWSRLLPPEERSP